MTYIICWRARRRQNSRRKKSEAGLRSRPPRSPFAREACCAGRPLTFSAGSFAAREPAQAGAKTIPALFQKWGPRSQLLGMPGPDPWGLTNPEIQPVLDGDPNSKFRLNFTNFGHSGFCLFGGVWSIGPLDHGPAAAKPRRRPVILRPGKGCGLMDH